MKSINKTKNDSISEQASATKEEMIEFASKYKNIEAFKDSDDETTYWVIMLFILLMYIDYNTQKLWESFAEEVKTKNRFFPESELLKKISDIAEKATCTISKGDILYRARDYTEQDFFKNDMVIALSEIMKDEFSNLEFDATDIFNESAMNIASIYLCGDEEKRRRITEKIDNLLNNKKDFYGFDKSNSDAPPNAYAKEGRANPKGISYLYTAKDIKTAILEMRPQMQKMYNIATIEIIRDAKIFDFTYSPEKIKEDEYSIVADLHRIWTDRLQSSSGDWSGNVFDFFFRVNSKIAKDIKKPFKLEGITRVDDTPVHKAVREALVNCLVNTDYFLPCGVVIKKEDDKLVIENPGSIRTGKKQMLRGGISDPRNKTLMKMFNMIGIGERAGSGIPDIYQVWENEGWPMPVVEESYNPDRTRLSLEFAKKQTIKTSEEEKEPKRSQKGAEKEPIKGAERKKEILKLIKVNSTITQVEIMKELDLTRKQVQKDMKELQEMHIIAREGTNRRGRWIIVKENK